MSQIQLQATVKTTQGNQPVKIMLPGNTPLVGIPKAAMIAVHVQHPYLNDAPIVAVKYYVRQQ